MRPDLVAKLLEDVMDEWRQGLERVAVLGRTADVLQFKAALRGTLGFPGDIELYTVDGRELGHSAKAASPVESINDLNSRVLVVVEDEDKEGILRSAREYLGDRQVKVLLAGYGHYAFREARFHAILDKLLVPSIANGYANCLIHIYQCLERAAAAGLDGSVAEFGVFKGGTTRFIAEVVAALGQRWRVYGFDTFEGFPPRRSLFDMYDHPGAEFSQYELVRRYLSDLDIDLVPGDIVETARCLHDKPMVLTFVDTDNYSAASAAITAVLETTVVGGAIVLDHFTGESRFRYTLGERMAASELLSPDPRYFNLHGTGVFLRIS